jgi:hypothetical protein
MKFIDYLRAHPRVCDPRLPGLLNFDVTPMLQGTTVFDCTEVAQQIIKGRLEIANEGSVYQFTPKGQELQEKGSWEVGIIPPFWNCFYEFPGNAFEQEGDLFVEWFGVCCVAKSAEHIAENFPGKGYAHVIYVSVFMKSLNKPPLGYYPILETVGMYAMDAEGMILRRHLQKTLPAGQDPNDPSNRPMTLPIVIALVSMMMLSHRFLRSTPVDPPPISRQVRRQHERKGTTPVPMSRYHVLSINPETTQPKDGSGVGGWHVAWHMVRAHLRHYKNGKVVPVRSHSRGNPTLGIVTKDYAVKVKV